MHGNHVGMHHGMGMGMHDGHMMKMWFHGGCDEVILFDFWRIGSISDDRLTTACSLDDVELICNQLFLNSLAHRFAAIAVILGAGFGHWLFAVLKFRDLAGETADSFATDACH
ncbi:unnamed protein product [Strongylus vulgaris]|uniref:Uncharacterized protein n=1 Tax=Strongylus vulgaris TaxID=40348 RepID=A0A3P7LTS0_STRVU|nr:unnamed protein product [Strongylus vulgaris]